jgi:hypothetical protein
MKERSMSHHPRPSLLRQGDVLLVPADAISSDDAELVWVTADRHVLAEGEATGHAHVVTGKRLRLGTWESVRRWGIREQGTVLVIDGGEAAKLEHEEHLPIEVPPGTYEVRRQREYRPTGPAWVKD